MKLIKTTIVILSILFSSCYSKAQEGTQGQKPLEECDCIKTFDALITKVEANYIGLAQQSKESFLLFQQAHCIKIFLKMAITRLGLYQM